ncbi:unnamed protein product [Echinostoma caproni]|uniref:Uncharacterized protein n=1 Tax=Echinostoma caproni TaxID=27848 RepID=A0A183B2I3_9TREM|nr:unnamed protein product [Echinostoma caproni]
MLRRHTRRLMSYPLQGLQDQSLLNDQKLSEPKKSADSGILENTIGQLTSRRPSAVSGG